MDCGELESPRVAEDNNNNPIMEETLTNSSAFKAQVQPPHRCKRVIIAPEVLSRKKRRKMENTGSEGNFMKDEYSESLQKEMHKVESCHITQESGEEDLTNEEAISNDDIEVWELVEEIVDTVSSDKESGEEDFTNEQATTKDSGVCKFMEEIIVTLSKKHIVSDY